MRKIQNTMSDTERSIGVLIEQNAEKETRAKRKFVEEALRFAFDQRPSLEVPSGFFEKIAELRSMLAFDQNLLVELGRITEGSGETDPLQGLDIDSAVENPHEFVLLLKKIFDNNRGFDAKYFKERCADVLLFIATNLHDAGKFDLILKAKFNAVLNLYKLQLHIPTAGEAFDPSTSRIVNREASHQGFPRNSVVRTVLIGVVSTESGKAFRQAHVSLAS